jgi:hypothetical protein
MLSSSALGDEVLTKVWLRVWGIFQRPGIYKGSVIAVLAGEIRHCLFHMILVYDYSYFANGVPVGDIAGCI